MWYIRDVTQTRKGKKTAGNLEILGKARPAPELSNLPTIRLFKLKLPTKARKCHFRHFRDKTCVNHTFRLEKGNNCVKICLVYYFFAGFV